LAEAFLESGRAGRADGVKTLRSAYSDAVERDAARIMSLARSLATRARVDLEDRPDRRPVGPGPTIRDAANIYGLTARELEILRLVAVGLTNRQIGERLFISPKTAGVHVSNILGKLGVASRIQAATIAERLGLVDDVGVPTGSA
jgi:DNA-binding NarL/FixJ family response regulator